MESLEEKNKLLLFASSKHKEQYIIDNFMSKTIDTTNFSTLSNLLNIMLVAYKTEKNIDMLEGEFSILYMKEVISEYKKIKGYSKFVKQPDYYKLANDIYSLYSELSISEFLSCDEKFREYITSINSNISETYEIINLYRKKLSTQKKYDDVMLYSDFLRSVSNNDFINYETAQYHDIEVIGFENISHRYLAFLLAIKNGYKKNVIVELPYDNEILDNYKKNINGFNITENKSISDFALSIINGNDKIKNYKGNIHFITGYGLKQEVYTAIDKVAELIKNGCALYDIAIVFDNAEKYHDIITERLKEYRVNYEERFGTPLWQVPIIPTLTSVFSVINILDGEREVKIEELIKILSSKYIFLNHIDNSKIRKIFYDDYRMFEIMPESNFLYKLNKKTDNDKIKDEILEIYSLIEKISKQKTFKEITDTYITLLKKFDIINTIKLNKETYERDNHTIAKFLDRLNELSSLDMEIDYKNYHTVLDMMIRDITLEKNNTTEKGISLLSSYDIRACGFKHLFLLGCNNTFLNRKAATFILDENTRWQINKKYSKNIIQTISESNILSRSFFLNIVSKLKNDSNIYFCFRFKDDSGSLDIPSIFVEEIFYSLTESTFNFENLKKNGAIFKTNYIPINNINTEKDALMSFFYHKSVNDKLPKNIYDITKSVLMRIDESDNKEIMKTITKNIFSNSLSVSDVESILSCPQMFIENKMFSSFDTSKHTIGIDHLSRGDIYHYCFNMLYESIKNKYGMPLSKCRLDDYKNIILSIIDNLEKDKAYRLSDEKEIDKNTLKEEIKTLMFMYIEKEIENNSEFIPEKFEYKIDNHTLCRFSNDTEIKLVGRVDRIDLHYDANNKIDGIRIVDYKASDNNKKSDDLSSETQLLLYLDSVISKYSDDINSIKYLEIAYSFYSHKNIMSNYFLSFSDIDTLKNVLYNTNDENNIKTKISQVIETMLNGDIEYNPSLDICKSCQKKNRCKEAMLD